MSYMSAVACIFKTIFYAISAIFRSFLTPYCLKICIKYRKYGSSFFSRTFNCVWHSLFWAKKSKKDSIFLKKRRNIMQLLSADAVLFRKFRYFLSLKKWKKASKSSHNLPILLDLNFWLCTMMSTNPITVLSWLESPNIHHFWLMSADLIWCKLGDFNQDKSAD